jgi:hypothetical protein
MAVRVTVSHLVVPTEAAEVTAEHIAVLVRRLLAADARQPGIPPVTGTTGSDPKEIVRVDV